jgi:hypothetical protein
MFHDSVGQPANQYDNRQTSTMMRDIFTYLEPFQDFGVDVFRFTWFFQLKDDRLRFWWLDFSEAFGFFAATCPI